MAPFSLCQLSNASRRISLNLLRQHRNTLAVSTRQLRPIRLSLQQPRFLHTSDDAKPDQSNSDKIAKDEIKIDGSLETSDNAKAEESTQINSDIAAEEGIKAYSSLETSDEAKPIVDQSAQISSDTVTKNDIGADSSIETSEDAEADQTTQITSDIVAEHDISVNSALEASDESKPIEEQSIHINSDGDAKDDIEADSSIETSNDTETKQSTQINGEVAVDVEIKVDSSLETSDNINLIEDQSTQINSDVAAEDGTRPDSSHDTSDGVAPIENGATQTNNNVAINDGTTVDASLETSVSATPAEAESIQSNSDISTDAGAAADSSVETNDNHVPVADDSVESNDDTPREQDIGDSDAPTRDLPTFSSDPKDEPKIKGRPWTEEELAQLEEFIKRPIISLNYIAIRMDRSVPSVMSQLSQIERRRGISILDRTRPETPWQHPMDATPEQVAIFEAKQDEMQQRMEHIVETLMTLPKSDQWEEILKLKSASEWASAILKLIPLRTWHILAADRPPGYKQYMTIPFIDRYKTIGVFARTYRRTVYIGLAEQPFGMMVPHDSKNPEQQDPTKKKPHRVNKNDSKGSVVPLIPVSLLDSKRLTYKEKVEQKYVLGLARAALTAWLGALHRNGPLEFRQLYAWKDIDWSGPIGMGPCNPLEYRIRLPLTPAESAARKASKEAAWKREAEEARRSEESWGSEEPWESGRPNAFEKWATDAAKKPKDPYRGHL
ncbi:uncharacterized protein BKA55DRAFT_534713 [Fusarium redolens]|uniref:Uncharacterized protein n=1 Tax=Fusarium redolens TaxID=48865 RepID=A0A9P9KNC3_FUSRE|nr:uncharacterized protein BKA55DRAFT_534713 [Fusarium redolens]KAH7264746.1 hypothetical protein BKA55DRAFT_534713 [Fusarium redolens]